MSLKAGRVGVSPSEVDELGHIKNGGAGGDSYTKEEADNKFAKKTNLTANNKEFQFAYDSETDSYGYKAGGADTFHPFSAGGALSQEGLSFLNGATAEGGYYEDENGIIVAIKLTLPSETYISNNVPLVSGLPVVSNSTNKFAGKMYQEGGTYDYTVNYNNGILSSSSGAQYFKIVIKGYVIKA